MSDTKILQAILNGQVKIREDIKELGNKINKVDKRVTNLGGSLAYLEDDAPTRDEHNKLEKRVKKIETKLALI